MSSANTICCRTADRCRFYPVQGSAALTAKHTDRKDGVICCTSFHTIELQDRSWIAPLLREEDCLSSLGCFGTMYLWGSAFGQKTARVEDRVLTSYEGEEGLCFGYPCGSGSLRRAVLLMKQTAEKHGRPLKINGMTGEQKDRLLEEFPDEFTVIENRDYADYVYLAEKLANLKGKKLQNKRNHCNRFMKDNPDWHFEEMEPRHFADCLRLLEQWEEKHEDGEEMEMQDAERLVISLAFEHFEELGLEGGVLYAGGRLAAFTLGEPVGKHGFDSHLEKADTAVSGAYQMVNREFARMLLEKHPDLEYINREEDMGMENLRKAKLSYYPDILLTKYSAVWNA